MENYRLRFNFPILYVNFVSTENNGYILTDPSQIPMPVGHIFVGDSRCHIKHDDGALTCDSASGEYRCFHDIR